MRQIPLLMVLTGTALLVLGCPPEGYDNSVPTSLIDIDYIRNDDDLTLVEKRAQLEALGVAPLTINALLNDERLGNQFGGDLRTAYDKVTTDFRELTPDEVQIYCDEASAVDAEDDLDVSLEDDQAQTVVLFFASRDLATLEQLEAYLDAGGSVLGNIPDGVLTELFIDFDPDLLLPLLP